MPNKLYYNREYEVRHASPTRRRTSPLRRLASSIPPPPKSPSPTTYKKNYSRPQHLNQINNNAEQGQAQEQENVETNQSIDSSNNNNNNSKDVNVNANANDGVGGTGKGTGTGSPTSVVGLNVRDLASRYGNIGVSDSSRNRSVGVGVGANIGGRFSKSPTRSEIIRQKNTFGNSIGVTTIVTTGTGTEASINMNEYTKNTHANANVNTSMHTSMSSSRNNDMNASMNTSMNTSMNMSMNTAVSQQVQMLVRNRQTNRSPVVGNNRVDNSNDTGGANSSYDISNNVNISDSIDDTNTSGNSSSRFTTTKNKSENVGASIGNGCSFVGVGTGSAVGGGVQYAQSKGRQWRQRRPLHGVVNNANNANNANNNPGKGIANVDVDSSNSSPNSSPNLNSFDSEELSDPSAGTSNSTSIYTTSRKSEISGSQYLQNLQRSKRQIHTPVRVVNKIHQNNATTKTLDDNSSNIDVSKTATNAATTTETKMESPQDRFVRNRWGPSIIRKSPSHTSIQRINSNNTISNASGSANAEDCVPITPVTEKAEVSPNNEERANEDTKGDGIAAEKGTGSTKITTTQFVQNRQRIWASGKNRAAATTTNTNAKKITSPNQTVTNTSTNTNTNTNINRIAKPNTDGMTMNTSMNANLGTKHSGVRTRNNISGAQYMNFQNREHDSVQESMPPPLVEVSNDEKDERDCKVGTNILPSANTSAGKNERAFRTNVVIGTRNYGSGKKSRVVRPKEEINERRKSQNIDLNANVNGNQNSGITRETEKGGQGPVIDSTESANVLQKTHFWRSQLSNQRPRANTPMMKTPEKMGQNVSREIEHSQLPQSSPRRNLPQQQKAPEEKQQKQGYVHGTNTASSALFSRHLTHMQKKTSPYHQQGTPQIEVKAISNKQNEISSTNVPHSPLKNVALKKATNVQTNSRLQSGNTNMDISLPQAETSTDTPSKNSFDRDDQLKSNTHNVQDTAHLQANVSLISTSRSFGSDQNYIGVQAHNRKSFIPQKNNAVSDVSARLKYKINERNFTQTRSRSSLREEMDSQLEDSANTSDIQTTSIDHSQDTTNNSAATSNDENADLVNKKVSANAWNDEVLRRTPPRLTKGDEMQMKSRSRETKQSQTRNEGKQVISKSESQKTPPRSAIECYLEQNSSSPMSLSPSRKSLHERIRKFDTGGDIPLPNPHCKMNEKDQHDDQEHEVSADPPSKYESEIFTEANVQSVSHVSGSVNKDSEQEKSNQRIEDIKSEVQDEYGEDSTVTEKSSFLSVSQAKARLWDTNEKLVRTKSMTDKETSEDTQTHEDQIDLMDKGKATFKSKLFAKAAEAAQTIQKSNSYDSHQNSIKRDRQPYSKGAVSSSIQEVDPQSGSYKKKSVSESKLLHPNERRDAVQSKTQLPSAQVSNPQSGSHHNSNSVERTLNPRQQVKQSMQNKTHQSIKLRPSERDTHTNQNDEYCVKEYRRRYENKSTSNKEITANNDCVAKLVAKLASVKRDDPSAALKLIDSILQSEKQELGIIEEEKAPQSNHERNLKSFQDTIQKFDNHSKVGHMQDETMSENDDSSCDSDSDDSTVSAITDPTYQSGFGDTSSIISYSHGKKRQFNYNVTKGGGISPLHHSFSSTRTTSSHHRSRKYNGHNVSHSPHGQSTKGIQHTNQKERNALNTSFESEGNATSATMASPPLVQRRTLTRPRPKQGQSSSKPSYQHSLSKRIGGGRNTNDPGLLNKINTCNEDIQTSNVDKAIINKIHKKQPSSPTCSERIKRISEEQTSPPFDTIKRSARNACDIKQDDSPARRFLYPAQSKNKSGTQISKPPLPEEDCVHQKQKIPGETELLDNIASAFDDVNVSFGSQNVFMSKNENKFSFLSPLAKKFSKVEQRYSKHDT